MLSSCARAATAAEARFRVQYPNSRSRTSRIFALDEGAAEAMYGITEDPWDNAHFLTVTHHKALDPDTAEADAVPLANPDGSPAKLSEEIEGATLIVLLASTGSNADAAEIIAREAWKRHIMTAALALGRGKGQNQVMKVVNTLRPFASVLVVAEENDFIAPMLTALRA